MGRNYLFVLTLTATMNDSSYNGSLVRQLRRVRGASCCFGDSDGSRSCIVNG